MFERLQHIDRRYIFIAIALAVIVPFLTGLQLPNGAVSPPTKDLYDLIDKLPARTPIMIAFDYGPASMPELQPMAVALVRHAFKKNLRILTVCLNVQGVPLAEDTLAKVAPEFSKVEDVDYLNLGFKSGGASVITGMGVDIQHVYRTVNEKPTAPMPVMAGIRNYQQIGCIIDLASSSTVDAWIQFAVEQFHGKLAAGVTAVMAVDYYPFLQTGQLSGFMNGLKGAADYEVLLGKRDKGVLGMASQSIAHALIVLFVVLGNIGYLMSRKPR
jgi:hypothetical protein